MADRKYSELSAASALTGTEILAVTQSSATVRTTAQAIANLAPIPTTIDLEDTGGDHDLTLSCAENLTGNRTLEIIVSNANRQLTISGDTVLGGGTMVDLDDSQTLSNKTLQTPRTAVQTLSGPGAVNTTTGATRVTTTGADALTLADGSEGQLKFIVMMVDGGDGTLTPANFGNGTTITFNDVGDSVLLIFLGTDWWIVSNNGCTVA